MITKNIKVNTTEDIKNLVDVAGRVNGDIAIENKEDNAKYDASSILGLFSVKPGSAMSVQYPDDAEEFDDFIRTLELDVAGRGY